MKQQIFSRAILLAALGTGLAGTAQAGLVNGSFEMLSVAMPAENYIITDATNVPGWKTTAADNQIEVWQAPGPDELPTPSDDGDRFAELNANLVSTLYQDVEGIKAGAIVGWRFAGTEPAIEGSGDVMETCRLDEVIDPPRSMHR